MSAELGAYALVCGVALGASALTLFSGFGLGTLLLPAFALVFPIEIAVAATAVVHLANNVFKVGLLHRHADWGTVARFGIPGAIATVFGALLLASLVGLPSLFEYTLAETVRRVSPIGLVVGLLILVFAVLELSPRFERRLQFPRKLIPLGGAISGFFGGLSGHQGALRSAVLVRSGLSKEAFIATGVICAVAIDVARVAVYGTTTLAGHAAQVAGSGRIGLVVAATVAAFAGALVGRRLMRKVTMTAIRRLVGTLLMLVGLLLAAGLI